MVFFCKGNMYHLDLNKAKEILEEEGHDSTQIGILLKNYPPLYDELKSAMDVWLEKREIFKEYKDKDRFLKYIKESHNKFASICHAYCLMGNHYHLIIQTPRANISKVMHYINTSYVVYYNRRHSRVGPLYQGRYKSILVYYCCHYILSHIKLAWSSM